MPENYHDQAAFKSTSRASMTALMLASVPPRSGCALSAAMRNDFVIWARDAGQTSPRVLAAASIRCSRVGGGGPAGLGGGGR